VDWVHRSWTGGAPGSTGDQSGASTEVAMAHGAPGAEGGGLTGGAGEGEQSRARLGDGSPRRNPRRRGDATGPESETVSYPSSNKQNRSLYTCA
jgi:hypothetical protein